MEKYSAMLENLKNAQALQARYYKLQATAEAGAGAVKITIDGRKMLQKLEIDPAYIKPEEKETLQDLIIAAVNLANEKIEEKIQVEMQDTAAAMLKGLSLDFLKA